MRCIKLDHIDGSVSDEEWAYCEYTSDPLENAAALVQTGRSPSRLRVAEGKLWRSPPGRHVRSVYYQLSRFARLFGDLGREVRSSALLSA